MDGSTLPVEQLLRSAFLLWEGDVGLGLLGDREERTLLILGWGSRVIAGAAVARGSRSSPEFPIPAVEAAACAGTADGESECCHDGDGPDCRGGVYLNEMQPGARRVVAVEHCISLDGVMAVSVAHDLTSGLTKFEKNDFAFAVEV